MEELRGRWIDIRELEDSNTLIGKKSIDGFRQEAGVWICNRCGNKDKQEIFKGPCFCGNSDCFYCAKCIQMGKVRRCTKFILLPEETPAFSAIKELNPIYKGELSDFQKKVSDELVDFYLNGNKKTHLVWAVTGAGKTELSFSVISQALKEGKRVAFASPRVDVCLELAPRFQAAFPSISQSILYGGAETPFKRCRFTILTTHQLLRFREAFDFIIVDEVDAFPFKDSDFLQVGLDQALKGGGKKIFLTATPTREMLSFLKNQWSLSVLSGRYHRHPLVLPKFVWCGNWKTAIENHKKVPGVVRRWVLSHVQSKRPFLLFVPEIEMIEVVVQALQDSYAGLKIKGISSISVDRKNVTSQMKNGEWDGLVTTTVLERGVTFEGINVAVLGSEEKVFTSEVLIQIAGRVGRSINCPDGEVVFFHFGRSRDAKKAYRTILQLNRLAQKQGVIL